MTLQDPEFRRQIEDLIKNAVDDAIDQNPTFRQQRPFAALVSYV